MMQSHPHRQRRFALCGPTKTIHMVHDLHQSSNELQAAFLCKYHRQILQHPYHVLSSRRQARGGQCKFAFIADHRRWAYMPERLSFSKLRYSHVWSIDGSSFLRESKALTQTEPTLAR